MPRSGWRRWRAWAPTPMPSRSGLNRKGRVTRKSRETQLSARVDLQGRGRAEVSTGLAFVDHMLEQVARYGGFDLRLRGAGDLQVDPHHLVEDAGIVLGQPSPRAWAAPAGARRLPPPSGPPADPRRRALSPPAHRPFPPSRVPGVVPPG